MEKCEFAELVDDFFICCCGFVKKQSTNEIATGRIKCQKCGRIHVIDDNGVTYSHFIEDRESVGGER